MQGGEPELEEGDLGLYVQRVTIHVSGNDLSRSGFKRFFRKIVLLNGVRSQEKELFCQIKICNILFGRRASAKRKERWEWGKHCER